MAGKDKDKRGGMSHEDAIDDISDAGMAGFGLGRKREEPVDDRLFRSTRSINHHEDASHQGYSRGARSGQYGGGWGGGTRRTGYAGASGGDGYVRDADGFDDAGFDRDGFYDVRRDQSRTSKRGSPYDSGPAGHTAGFDEAVQASRMQPDEKLAWHVRKAQEHLMDAMDCSGFVVTGSAQAISLKAMIDHDMAKMLRTLIEDATNLGHLRKADE